MSLIFFQMQSFYYYLNVFIRYVYMTERSHTVRSQRTGFFDKKFCQIFYISNSLSLLKCILFISHTTTLKITYYHTQNNFSNN